MAPSPAVSWGLLALASQFAFSRAQDAEIEKATNDSLLWGPYRPNLYFGVRPRIPKSLMGGLMWTRVEDYTSVQNSKIARAGLYNRPIDSVAGYRFQTHMRAA
jgi:mannosyl-oligosaccharide glucosidase